MVETIANKNNKDQIILLVPRSFNDDEKGWAYKFSTEANPVKVVNSKNPSYSFVGIVVYAIADDAEGSAEAAEFFTNSYKNVPAHVNMTDPGSFNTTELCGKIADARASIEQVFKGFDKDNSGTISRDELKQAIAQTGVEMN
jgi:hypothetical protein